MAGMQCSHGRHQRNFFAPRPPNSERAFERRQGADRPAAGACSSNRGACVSSCFAVSAHARAHRRVLLCSGDVASFRSRPAIRASPFSRDNRAVNGMTTHCAGCARGPPLWRGFHPFAAKSCPMSNDRAVDAAGVKPESAHPGRLTGLREFLRARRSMRFLVRSRRSVLRSRPALAAGSFSRSTRQ